MTGQDSILKQLKYTKMDFSAVFNDLNKIIENSKVDLPIELQAKVNQFQQKSGSIFKGVDLTDPKSMTTLNERLEQLKKLQDGIANHK